MRNRLLKSLFWIAVILFAAIANLAFAENGGPIQLTLSEAVRISLQQNPRLQISNINVAQAQEDRSISRSNLLPQANLGVSDGVEKFNFDTFLGKHQPQNAIGPFQIFQAGANFSSPVFDLSLWRRYQAEGFAVQAARSQSQAIHEQTVLLVVSQYLFCLRADANVKAVQTRVELATALHKLASDRQSTGAGTGLDTLRANVELQNEKQQLIVAQTEYQTGLYALSRLLSLDPQRSIELTDQVSFFETPVSDVEKSLEQAYANRPEMKAILADELRLQKDRSAASDSRLPSFTVDGGWAYNGLSVSTSIPIYQVTAAVSVPLYTGGRIKAEIAKADLDLKKIEQQKQDLSNQIAQQVLTASARMDAARNEVTVANDALKLADDEVLQARDRLQAGVANNIEVITAQDALSRANDNQINALYRYNQSRADLAFAMGKIEATYE